MGNDAMGGGGGGRTGNEFTEVVVPAHLEQKKGLQGPVEQATKHDSGKPMLSLYPMRAYIETCRVFTFGANKYSIGNWHTGDGFDWRRPVDASLRHHVAWLLGQNTDPESGCHILAHAACEVAMLLEHCLTGLGKDTRDHMQYHPQGGKGFPIFPDPRKDK